MKKLICIVLAMITIHASAQDFAPLGAIWHYGEGTINPDFSSFLTLESISDTVIDGISCRKIKKVDRYTINPKTSYFYMYSENDSVFYSSGGNFHILYDFGANAGDTIVLDYATHDGSNLLMIIDSTATTMVNDVERKIQYITCGDGIVIEFGTMVIEGIGNCTHYMFPTLDGHPEGELRCYEDSITGLYLNPFCHCWSWNHEDCEEEVYTDINENNVDQKINVYPNPAGNQVIISNISEPAEFQFFNLLGQIVKKGITLPAQSIDISDLQSGTYLLELETSKGISRTKFVKR